MGYYTAHNLKIHKVENEFKNNDEYMDNLEYNINKAIEQHDTLNYSLCQLDGWNADTCKWYRHVDDMIEFSKQFPDVVFELEGIGEESGDLWKEYYKNGLYQDCPAKITYDEYDPKKLSIRTRGK